MALSASEGPAPGTWRYNLHDGQHNRAAYGRVAGKADHMDVLRYAAGTAQPDTSPELPNAASWNNSPPAPDTFCAPPGPAAALPGLPVAPIPGKPGSTGREGAPASPALPMPGAPP